MFRRPFLALTAVLVLPLGGFAQGIVTPYRPPTVLPGAPGPIRPLFPHPSGNFPIITPIPVYWPTWCGWGGWYPPTQVIVFAPPVAPVPATANPAPNPDDWVIARAELPATLKLEFPAPADVWWNGEKQAGPATSTREIQSLPLKLGTEYTFSIVARWTADGTTYEVSRTSTVPAGRTGKLLVIRGTPVK